MNLKRIGNKILKKIQGCDPKKDKKCKCKIVTETGHENLKPKRTKQIICEKKVK